MTIAARLGGAALVLAILLAGAGTAGAASLKEGRALAQKNCGLCHAVGAKGASPNPKSPPFRTLSQRYPIESLQEALAEGITVGHEGLDMPEFRFAPAQMDSLVGYIKSLAPEKPASTSRPKGPPKP